MKKTAILSTCFFLFLQSCAVSRPNDLSTVESSSDDDDDIKDFLLDDGTLNCAAHPRENVAVELVLTFKDKKITKAQLEATSKENKAANVDKKTGWFHSTLKIEKDKVDLKGDNKSIKLYTLVNGDTKSTLEIERILKGKRFPESPDDKSKLLTGLLTYNPGTGDVLINGTKDAIKSVFVDCYKFQK